MTPAMPLTRDRQHGLRAVTGLGRLFASHSYNGLGELGAQSATH